MPTRISGLRPRGIARSSHFALVGWSAVVAVGAPVSVVLVAASSHCTLTSSTLRARLDVLVVWRGGGGGGAR